MPRILVHELAHEIYRNLDLIDKELFFQVAEWRTDKNGTLFTSRKRFVAPDGDLGPAEDFANNLEYFIYDKKELRRKSSAIYDWFHIEYGDKIDKQEEVK